METYEVSVEQSFRADHAIRLDDGSLERSHKHLWKVTATFRSERLDESMGVVVDFVDIRRALESVAAELDGSNLNELEALSGRSPSAERVAEYIAGRLGERLARTHAPYRVMVTEAPGCFAAYYPHGA